jgi:catechol 2,3-dioxygenase-like lactoylglutathione lyase family enzyme
MKYLLTEKTNSVFEIQGLSHVALVSADMQRTVDFYQGVLGFPLIKTTEIPGGGQHFFFDMGDGKSSLAFFYFPEKHVAEPGVTVPKANVGDPDSGFNPDSYTTAIGSMNHLAFRVAPEKLMQYKEKLESLGIWVSPIMYHFGKDGVSIGVAPDEQPWLTSIYFRDPDGIQLEFGAWWRPLTDNDINHKPATRADAPTALDQRGSRR